MAWQCQMREPPTAADRKAGVRVGDMWYAPWMISGTETARYMLDHYLSTRYAAEHMARRPPLMVRLPGGIDFCIDSRADSPGGESGWTVTGEPPAITVSPSINVMHHYHGFIREGVITDDCEGRRYSQEGSHECKQADSA